MEAIYRGPKLPRMHNARGLSFGPIGAVGGPEWDADV